MPGSTPCATTAQQEYPAARGSDCHEHMPRPAPSPSHTTRTFAGGIALLHIEASGGPWILGSVPHEPHVAEARDGVWEPPHKHQEPVLRRDAAPYTVQLNGSSRGNEQRCCSHDSCETTERDTHHPHQRKASREAVSSNTTDYLSQGHSMHDGSGWGIKFRACVATHACMGECVMCVCYTQVWVCARSSV